MKTRTKMQKQKITFLRNNHKISLKKMNIKIKISTNRMKMIKCNKMKKNKYNRMMIINNRSRKNNRKKNKFKMKNNFKLMKVIYVLKDLIWM